jgi:hypothetical protein
MSGEKAKKGPKCSRCQLGGIKAPQMTAEESNVFWDWFLEAHDIPKQDGARQQRMPSSTCSPK